RHRQRRTGSTVDRRDHGAAVVDGRPVNAAGEGAPISVEERAARRLGAVDRPVYPVERVHDEAEQAWLVDTRRAGEVSGRLVVLGLAGRGRGSRRAFARVLGGVVRELAVGPRLVTLDDAGDRLPRGLADRVLALRGVLVGRDESRVLATP